MKRYIISEEKRSALESLGAPFAVYQYIDKRIVTILLSDGFCEFFGYEDREEAARDMDRDMYKCVHPDDVARVADAAVRFATEGGKFEAIYRTRKKDGFDYVVIHAIGKHVYTEDGVRLAHVWYTDEGAYVEDNGSDKIEIIENLSKALHEQNIFRNSRYDYLTGLPNMTYFFERAGAEKEAILDAGGQAMMLYIDFGGMKFFNARHSFAEGDKLLKTFAGFLNRAFGSDNCCRIGADHFAVITEGRGLEEKLGGIFHKFGELYGGSTPPVRVGIYPNWSEDIPASAACDRAKLACTSLSSTYASAYNYYNADLREDAIKKQYVIETIDIAIREKWIQLYLQPIVRTVNGKICDVEALSRWKDPVKGILSPAYFIPALEEAGLIYKLDLYMVDQVLEAIRIQMEEGFIIVPHSINLSRSDFDTCDIVEEIRKRVDAAGVGRDKITIEITESVIARDFEFMKSQIERFKKLGFPVWMDDFGSGYSSLELLQSIRFDLIKFDLGFMRKLNEGKDGRIILTDLMRMAASLGLDTVCEGVETEGQILFLQEIGCTKLQGTYFGLPISFDQVREMHRSNTLTESENPEEEDYYESISRVNLFDLGVIAGGDDNPYYNAFSQVPTAILEVKNNMARYARSNRAYQDFARRFFGIDIMEGETDFGGPSVGSSAGYGSTFNLIVRECCETGNGTFFDEKMPDGAVVHSFVRRLSVNPVTGSVAVIIAVLSITEPLQSLADGSAEDKMPQDYTKLLHENVQLKREAAVIRKVAELKESVSTWLDNLPAVMYLKDADTGKYLLCNGLFAARTNKETPSDVVGLTDFEIFDREMAARFVENDKKIARMDVPYVFYEDVLDAAGHQMQVQTTMMKFVDRFGRRCLLGLSQDVTDAVYIRR
ncbi:MAG: EAL domain-containing protein [Lachnospiraceae bacterium]|nr:EAL domain-containing protein [Lachnospiraceae bacterium]